jgi:hypothetical protein
VHILCIPRQEDHADVIKPYAVFTMVGSTSSLKFLLLDGKRVARCVACL